MIALRETPRVAEWRRQKHALLWECWHDPPADVLHMNMLARQVAGIMGLRLGFCAGRIATTLNQPTKKIDCIMEEIRHSRHPVIRVVRHYGLPVVASVPVPEGSDLRCGACHIRLSEVPCISCHSRRSGRWRPQVQSNGVREQDCNCGTTYPPGSEGKIAVMRRRLEAGYSVFSECDLCG